SEFSAEGTSRDLHNCRAVRRPARQGVHRGVPGRLHIRGQPDALHPPRRVRRLRRLRAGLSGGGDLLRGRRAGAVEGLHRGQLRVLRRSRLARWRLQDRQDRQGRPLRRRSATARDRALTSVAVPHSGPRSGLPDFPWDRLEPAEAVARSHPDGIGALSMGTPADPLPPVVRAALAAAADSPGYPLTAGTPALRSAITSWVLSACDAAPGFGVLPSIGSKELVAWLPTLLGVGPGDIVV